MNKIEEDFEDIQLMVLEFLNQDGIKEKLFFLFGFRRDDWEKWFQIEFAFFIQKNFEVSVEREVPANTKSPLNEGSKFFIDVLYRLEDDKKYIFLEIKCNRSSSALKRGLTRDISKLRHIKPIPRYPQRSSWCIGFHRSCKTHDIQSMQRFLSNYKYSKHEVLKLCQCGIDFDCNCEKNQLGVSIVFCGAGQSKSNIND